MTPAMADTAARRGDAPTEHRETFACFGSDCTVIVSDRHRGADAAASVQLAEARLLEWHRRFSRFEPDSELSSLNADPRITVPVSPLLRRIIEAGLWAAQETGGLVDPTLATDIEQAGYDSHFEGGGLPLSVSLSRAPAREPGGPDPSQSWRQVEVDRRAGVVTRPLGVRFDAGGIAKGVFADELASLLSGYDAYVLDCAGDIRLGGRSGILRPVDVASPFDEQTLHTFELAARGVATSGIGKRSWLGLGGRPAHHLLDPRTGSPAFTGIVQVTALAPTATEAEARSKAALLSGPQSAEEWLVHGGVVVLEDGSHRVVTPLP